MKGAPVVLLFHHFEAVLQDIVLLFVSVYFQVLLLGRQKFLDCIMYQSFQHLGFHSVINTQEHRNRSKINIPLYSSLGPMHQLLH